jgi:hypothetical protein
MENRTCSGTGTEEINLKKHELLVNKKFLNMGSYLTEDTESPTGKRCLGN